MEYWSGIVRLDQRSTSTPRSYRLQPIYRKLRTSIPEPLSAVYPYLLSGLTVSRPNQVWAADLTYIPMAHGFQYLVAIIDLYSRKVMAWRVRPRHRDPGATCLPQSLPDPPRRHRGVGPTVRCVPAEAHQVVTKGDLHNQHSETPPPLTEGFIAESPNRPSLPLM